MRDNESLDQITAHGCEEGVALVHQAQDGGDWRPVVDWLIHHPACVTELGAILRGEKLLHDAVNPSAKRGTTLGGLALLEELGRGAMGVVYRAGCGRRPGSDLREVPRARPGSATS